MKIPLSSISPEQATQKATTISRTARLLTQYSITATMIFFVCLFLLFKLSSCEDQCADDKCDEKSCGYELVSGTEARNLEKYVFESSDGGLWCELGWRRNDLWERLENGRTRGNDVGTGFCGIPEATVL